jgi:hypothetical protein
MNTPRALEGVCAQLLRRGVPTDYAQRAAGELADHHQDLVEELRAAGHDEAQAIVEADRRLGDARTLIKKTLREYQQRYWCGRWPLITFLLGPIPLLILAWVGSSLVLLCIGWQVEKLDVAGPYEPDGVISTGERLVIYVMQGSYLFAVPALVMFGLARLAKRAALHWAWVGVAACVLATSMASIRCGIPDPVPAMLQSDGSTLPADRYFCVLELPDSWSTVWSWFGLEHIQGLLPLAVASVMLLHFRKLADRSARLVLDGC